MATNPADRGRTAGDGKKEGVPAEVIEDVLAAPRRRLLLAFLRERDEPTPVDDVAIHVASEESGADPDAVGDERRRAVRHDIYQTHLPKLTATEIVRFDSMLGTVEFAGSPAIEDRLDESAE